MANGWCWAWRGGKGVDFSTMLTAAATAYKTKYSRWPTKAHVNPAWLPAVSKVDLPGIGVIEVLADGPTHVGDFLLS